ncbi:MFS transporter, DHA2 family, multidrug resistance protein [Dyadobacter sp. SG02]|uniref:MFS transporter n=1 Tax=Dyadobacter sp. SG02 TaxID=1855291 RepID=UPI0008BE2DA4|nr:MFS transporter [Dyadobacter sp. SG02]SEJ59875.1 MFS transporter, DHA2 family, multidrug resistance protein [Dyadobacter sp. SG02]
MNNPEYFQRWVVRQRPLLYLILVAMLLVGLSPFGLYALNQAYVLGAFGAQPEDVTFSMQITYVGIIAFLPIQFRLLRYFEARSYLITIMLLAIVMSFLSMQVRDIYVFMVLRLLTGFLTAAFGGRMLTLIFGLLKPGPGQIIGSSMFYGSALGGITVAGLATAAVADRMAWQHIYLFLIFAQAICILLILLIFRSKSDVKPYPLYQVDWISFLLATGILLLTVYVFLYGPRYYWFSDVRVCSAAFGALVGVTLFAIRQSRRRRPYLHLHIFKSKQFIIGIILLTLFYGMKDTITLIYGLTGGVLRWNSNDIMQLAAVNLTGLVTSMACTAWLMIRLDKKRPLVMIAGFGVMLAYHWWMYQIFSTDLSFSDLALPVFMQGVACGMLFVPLVGFSVAALPSYTGFAGITVAAAARLAAGLNSSAGLYTLQLFYNQSNKENFLAFLSDTNFLFAERSGAYTRLFASQGFAAEQAASAGKSILFRNTLVQSQLLTNMAIFKIVAIISSIIMAGLVLMVIVKSLKAKKSLSAVGSE